MYTITRFGSYDFPVAAGMHSHDGHPVVQQMRLSPTGGPIDRYGFNNAPPGTFILNHEFAIFGTSPANAKTIFDTLRALVGQRKRLYRRWDDNTWQWARSRLISVNATRQAENRNVLPVSLQFEIVTPYWFNVEENNLGGSSLNVSTSTFTPTGGGGENPEAIGYISINNTNSPDYHYLVIEIDNDGDDITEILIENTGFNVFDSIQWAGTLASSERLQINTNNKTIFVGAVPAYSGFIQNHVAPDWFVLQPGGNLIAITLTGTSFTFNCTATIHLYEGFH